MVTIKTYVNDADLRRIMPDVKEHTVAFVGGLGTDVIDPTISWIRGAKLSLPGPPVRKGGTPGPYPGNMYDQVLHEDTGRLKNSISWLGRRPKPNENARVITFQFGIDRRKGSKRYAFAHEFGWSGWVRTKNGRVYFLRIKKRPYLLWGKSYANILLKKHIRSQWGAKGRHMRRVSTLTRPPR